MNLYGLSRAITGSKKSPKALAPRPDKAFRHFPDDIDGVLRHYGRQAEVVQLWRWCDQRKQWIYLERVRPREYDPNLNFPEIVKVRFGGGSYRAKIYGAWDRRLRRELYLEQVSFAIEGPPTSATQKILARVRARRV